MNAVLVLTDATPNAGTTNMDALVRETGLASAQARRELRISQRLPVDQDYPWAVHTFGFGSNHDPAILAEVAASGKGVYSFIRQGDLVANAVADCFGGLASSVALRVEVSVRPAIGCELKVSKKKKKTKEILALFFLLFSLFVLLTRLPSTTMVSLLMLATFTVAKRPTFFWTSKSVLLLEPLSESSNWWIFTSSIWICALRILVLRRLVCLRLSMFSDRSRCPSKLLRLCSICRTLASLLTLQSRHRSSRQPFRARIVKR